jgi:hypothetical protein
MTHCEFRVESGKLRVPHEIYSPLAVLHSPLILRHPEERSDEGPRDLCDDVRRATGSPLQAFPGITFAARCSLLAVRCSSCHVLVFWRHEEVNSHFPKNTPMIRMFVSLRRMVTRVMTVLTITPIHP